MSAQAGEFNVLDRLRQRIESVQQSTAVPFSSGCLALDRILPKQAFHRGTLVEFLSECGGGATSLALMAACEACKDGRPLIIVDREQRFYPPAAAHFQVDSDIIFVRPRTQKDYLWALNQSLCCEGVGAVLSWLGTLNDRVFRSLQLASERGGTAGLLVRPIALRGHPTWSELQLLVEPIPTTKRSRQMQVTLTRCRHGKAGASVILEFDDETGTLQEPCSLPMSTELGVAAHSARSVRA